MKLLMIENHTCSRAPLRAAGADATCRKTRFQEIGAVLSGETSG